ncbi:CapA family protein [soil metagenome]
MTVVTDAWMERVSDPREIPDDSDILTPGQIECAIDGPGPALLIGGDVMLGSRAKRNLEAQGSDYAFRAILPLLKASKVVCVNLEGPFARVAAKQVRNHSYRVHPKHARTLRRANISLVALANNHLLDCGREGVTETLETLRDRQVSWIGGGANESQAYCPFLMEEGGLKIAVLNYYWNRRTAARKRLPGSARATEDHLRRDIPMAKANANRVVVIFHSGVPYVLEPSDEDRAFAQLAVECGADAVVCHHPHVIRPLEIYAGIPIFYSIGNLAFGSGNSKAQGMLVGLDFTQDQTTATIYPLYVKNRDVRVDYQPKLITGDAAEYIKSQLGEHDFKVASLGWQISFPAHTIARTAIS